MPEKKKTKYLPIEGSRKRVGCWTLTRWRSIENPTKTKITIQYGFLRDGKFINQSAVWLNEENKTQNFKELIALLQPEINPTVIGLEQKSFL